MARVITIARVALGHIVIDNPVLAKLGDSYRLEDLHSTNGTQVNGVPITDADLNDGDKIRFDSLGDTGKDTSGASRK